MIKRIVLIACLIFSGFAQAQDSLRTLSATQLIQVMKQFHPVIRQADIAMAIADAEVKQARGAFDPVFNQYNSKKTFNGTDYYDYQSPEIRIPTWYGIEIYSGLENLSGNRLDPSQTTGQSSYLGVQIPLVKNLMIDKRRAALQQAKIMNQLSEVERASVINNLLMEALEAYWNWVKANQTYQVIANQVNVNIQRLDLVKQSFVLGERPAIDTIEALAQLQSFKQELNQQKLEAQNAALQLSAYLWTTEQQAYILPETVQPVPNWEQDYQQQILLLNLNELLAKAEKNHPDLRKYDFKLDALTVEKRLKFQDLLPKVDLTYNHLAKDSQWFAFDQVNPLFEQNYQYGLKVAIPLRFSQGRGAYKEARLKLETTRLDQQIGRQKVELKIRSYYNELQILKDQLALQATNYKNYQELVRAEEIRFMNGESSLFLINTRESKALEALEKLIELKIKYAKTGYALQWSAGLLN